MAPSRERQGMKLSLDCVCQAGGQAGGLTSLSRQTTQASESDLYEDEDSETDSSKDPVSPRKEPVCMSQDLEKGIKLVGLRAPAQPDADVCLICMETDTVTLAMECCGNGINCEKKRWCFACIENQNAISKSIPRCPFCRAMLPASMVWASLAQRYVAQCNREELELPIEVSADNAGVSGLRKFFNVVSGLAMFMVVMFAFVLAIYVVLLWLE